MEKGKLVLGGFMDMQYVPRGDMEVHVESRMRA